MPHLPDYLPEALGGAAGFDWCLHAANLCYLASFLGRDMLWLRILTCCGLLLGIVFFTCGSQPMYGPTAWHAAFLGINLIQIARLVRHRKKVQLSAERASAGERAFHELSREELADLLTRSVRLGPRTPAPVAGASLAAGELTEDERVLRDVAFGGLSRAELLNLVTRRLTGSLGGSLARVTPARVKRWTRRRARDRRKQRRAGKK